MAKGINITDRTKIRHAERVIPSLLTSTVIQMGTKALQQAQKMSKSHLWICVNSIDSKNSSSSSTNESPLWLNLFWGDPTGISEIIYWDSRDLNSLLTMWTVMKSTKESFFLRSGCRIWSASCRGKEWRLSSAEGSFSSSILASRFQSALTVLGAPMIGSSREENSYVSPSLLDFYYDSETD